MATNLSTVSREHAFLETYFQCIGQFLYDKAKDLCEKERDLNKVPPSSTWGIMLSSLIHLALAEKGYALLLFLGQKWFGRKDNLRLSYGTLLGELKKLEESVLRGDSSTDGSLERLLAHLCGHLGHFITARSKTMDFYEQLSTMATLKVVSYEDLLSVITDIIQAHQKNFHHPILASLKNCFTLECDIINHLLEAQLEICKWRFLPSLLHLHEAHTKLAAWSALLPPKEPKRLVFGSSSKNTLVPALYNWLHRYKGLLVSKFSLYFYETLTKQASSGDIKSLMTKTSVDFVGKIIQYQRKSDATSVALVFDMTGLGERNNGPGYQHPNRFTDTPKGLDSYPTMFSFPLEKAEKHWPGVVSIMNDKATELNSLEKTTYFCDERIQSTYFMCRIEPRITFVVIFETKKSEKDSYTTTFINDICIHLRGTKLFSSLKPG